MMTARQGLTHRHGESPGSAISAVAGFSDRRVSSRAKIMPSSKLAKAVSLVHRTRLELVRPTDTLVGYLDTRWF